MKVCRSRSLNLSTVLSCDGFERPVCYRACHNAHPLPCPPRSRAVPFPLTNVPERAVHGHPLLRHDWAIQRHHLVAV